MAKKRKKPVGRPRIIIDWQMVDKLLAIQCTGEEVAGFLGISVDTLERRCKGAKKKTYAEYSKIKRGVGKISLRRKQWQLADTNPAMAIFLGKQYLDQTDKIQQELTGKDGKPLIQSTKIVVEYCDPKPEKQE